MLGLLVSSAYPLSNMTVKDRYFEGVPDQDGTDRFEPMRVLGEMDV
jgi:hypothetical protein